MEIFKKSPDSAEFRQEEYQKAANALREMVKQSQEQDITEVLTVENVSNTLQQADCDEVVCMQMYIFMREGDVTRYVTQKNPGVCSIECNNIVMSAAERSGLDQRTVIALLNVILYALSMAPEQRYSVKVENGQLSTVLAAITTKDERTLRNIRTVLNEYEYGNEEESEEENNDIVQALDDLNTMANAGIPEALFLKGKCYFEGIGMPKDQSAAFPYLVAASRGGSAEANAMLGDYYFEQPNIRSLNKTEAFERYTALGAVALSEKRKRNLKALIEERSLNRKLVVINFLAFVASVVLNILLTKGVFSADKRHIFLGIVAIFFSTVVYGASVYEFIKRPYDEQRWVIPALIVITLIFILIIV